MKVNSLSLIPLGLAVVAIFILLFTSKIPQYEYDFMKECYENSTIMEKFCRKACNFREDTIERCDSTRLSYTMYDTKYYKVPKYYDYISDLEAYLRTSATLILVINGIILPFLAINELHSRRYT